MKWIIWVLIVILMIFWAWYITRLLSDLKETDVKENIIISLKGKTGLYLLDPNTEKLQTFSWSFSIIEKINLELDTKVYSPNWEFYFKESWIFTKNDKYLVKSWLYPALENQFFWTFDSKYLIRTDGHVVRLFWLFFSTPTLQQVIHIVEPSTGKSKQILLYDENGQLLEIDQILWYLD